MMTKHLLARFPADKDSLVFPIRWQGCAPTRRTGQGGFTLLSPPGLAPPTWLCEQRPRREQEEKAGYLQKPERDKQSPTPRTIFKTSLFKNRQMQLKSLTHRADTHPKSALCKVQEGSSPSLCVHYDGSGPVVIPSQHHPDGFAVQPVHIDGIRGLTGPVQGMAVYINAEVMWLLLWVLTLVWSTHYSERLQDNTWATISSHYSDD